MAVVRPAPTPVLPWPVATVFDSPEPIFGLAVTGHRRQRQTEAEQHLPGAGCQLYLTKPLGVGILTTAQNRKKLLPEHEFLARDVMCIMNTIGAEVSQLEGVEAITDVTGFGLMGHLLEVCEGSGVNAGAARKCDSGAGAGAGLHRQRLSAGWHHAQLRFLMATNWRR